MFSHLYRKVNNDPLLEEEEDSDSTFVARIRLTPPKMGVPALCFFQSINEEAKNVDREFPSLCVAGGIFLKLRERTLQHKGYKSTWAGMIVMWSTLIVTAIATAAVMVVLTKTFGSDDEDSDESSEESRGWLFVGQHVVIWTISICAAMVAIKARLYVERNSDSRRTAIQSFRSDLQSALAEITDFLIPFGYVISTQEKEEEGDSSIEAVISKSVSWNKDTALPPVAGPDETSQGDAMVTEVLAALVQGGAMARDTPLDIWLFGGLMMRLSHANNVHTQRSRRCAMVAGIPLFTFWIAVLFVAYIMPFLYAMLLFASLPVIVVLYIVGASYYRETTDAPSVHAAFLEIVESMSPMAEERAGYSMDYSVEPGWLYGTTKGMIRLHKKRRTEN